jgi:hypothetical protein
MLPSREDGNLPTLAYIKPSFLNGYMIFHYLETSVYSTCSSLLGI